MSGTWKNREPGGTTRRWRVATACAVAGAAAWNGAGWGMSPADATTMAAGCQPVSTAFSFVGATGGPNADGLQPFTVPPAVTELDMTVTGANGGASERGPGGRGAVLGVNGVPVTSGSTVTVLVGGAGQDGLPLDDLPSSTSAGGGGGGSFVYTSAAPLVASGGGGGSSTYAGYLGVGIDGSAATTSGNSGGPYGGAGGIDGGGGQAASSANSSGGGGGGFVGSGGSNGGDGSAGGGASVPAGAGGGYGGGWSAVGGSGGFGGGGGGSDSASGGGGGGFSGGGGGQSSEGGGGGSYSVVPAASTGLNTDPSGNGSVTITYAAPATVTFDSQGGSVVGQETVPCGDTASTPTAPTRDGYTFDGWYTAATDGTPYDFTAAVTADLTVFAHWSPITSPDPCAGATGMPITDQFAAGSTTTAARGTAGSWSFTVSMQNCTGAPLGSAKLQGVTAGWLTNARAVTNIQAGTISIAPYVKSKGQIVRWTPFTLAHGARATITVSVTGTVTTGTKCGSQLPLSGAWTGTGLTPAGTSLSATVSAVPKITVTC